MKEWWHMKRVKSRKGRIYTTLKIALRTTNSSLMSRIHATIEEQDKFKQTMFQINYIQNHEEFNNDTEV